ncbi:MAG: SGNH/GDSL hydrolase family protein [Pirellulaceae bacterium]|jgi:lysophospholipase L1-like esterase|nr:SGNH/GDSL hydrolase family protein [Pirellulaceae bacterium]
MPNLARRRRLWILLAVGGLLIAGSAFYIQYFLARPIGSGPTGPAVDSQPFQHVWTDRRVKVLGLGDSITAGLGADRIEHSFFSRLIANPDDEFADMQGNCLSAALPNLEYENLAVSGSASREHAVTIAERLPEHDPEVFGLVVMTTGGNDLIHSYGRLPPRECAMYGATLAEAQPWIAAFEQRLSTMLDMIESRFPGGCEIFLADIYDPTDGVGDAPSVYLPHWPDGLAIHAEYNRAINRCAAERPNVHIVPLHAAFLGHGSHCRQFWRSTYDAEDPNYWYFDNIEDPNDRGYDAIRRVFLNEIVKHSALRRPDQEHEHDQE